MVMGYFHGPDEQIIKSLEEIRDLQKQQIEKYETALRARVPTGRYENFAIAGCHA
jgi:hypothetical protein